MDKFKDLINAVENAEGSVLFSRNDVPFNPIEECYHIDEEDIYYQIAICTNDTLCVYEVDIIIFDENTGKFKVFEFYDRDEIKITYISNDTSLKVYVK